MFAVAADARLQRSAGRARLLRFKAVSTLACLGRLRARFGDCRAAHAAANSRRRHDRAAGNSAGAVLFPAFSPHVLAVGAIGQVGSYSKDTASASGRGGLAGLRRAVCAAIFLPRAELDSAQLASRSSRAQSPDGYSICDGTSLASAHVTALAA